MRLNLRNLHVSVMRLLAIGLASLGLVALFSSGGVGNHRSATAALEFSPVSLGGVAFRQLESIYQPAPIGSPIVLGGVPFTIPGGTPNFVSTQTASSGPTTVSIPVNIPGASTVHLLLNTGNSFVACGLSPGNVVLTFSDGGTQALTLALGENIREWAAETTLPVPQCNRFTTDQDVSEVWRVPTPANDGNGVIDKLRIPISGAPRTLTNITINDTSTQTAGSQDLNIGLAGITVEAETGPFCTVFTLDGTPNVKAGDRIAILGSQFGPTISYPAYVVGVSGTPSQLIGQLLVVFGRQYSLATVMPDSIPSGQYTVKITDVEGQGPNGSRGVVTCSPVLNVSGTSPPQLTFPWSYGQKWYFTGGPHDWIAGDGTRSGLDFAPTTPDRSLYAASGGTVYFAGTQNLRCGPGKVAKIRHHGSNWETWYLHLASFPAGWGALPANGLVNVPVFAGSYIGEAGSSGACGSLHVHVELVYVEGQSVARHVSWDGQVIDGWTAHAACTTPVDPPPFCDSSGNYQGTMTSGASTVIPDENPDADQLIGRSTNANLTPALLATFPLDWGNVAQHSATLASSQGKARFMWEWFTGTVNGWLTDPNGIVITATSGYPGLTFGQSGTSQYYDISAPPAGQWTLHSSRPLAAGTALTTEGTAGDLDVTVLAGSCTAPPGDAVGDRCDADDDGDGCTDTLEVGDNHLDGGQRDPLDGWDFFDVPAPALSEINPGGTQNKAVTLADVQATLYYVGTRLSSPTLTNANGVSYGGDFNGNGVYDGQEYDRTPSAFPGQPWRSGPSNGAVSLQDVQVGLAQVGDNCN